ncbi:hypothetical protein TIFTF001_026775 [Ficus carica]|uniref:Retrotransposon gag domain-containing protein n=1 Tax=Ficus carica TaxID=3494 RepID=A0AA88DM42_FICCA|nr:hypothetical protein TIFTF001_026775 [Ficus carica]
MTRLLRNFRNLNHKSLQEVQTPPWIRTMERMFSYAKVPNADKVSCATFMLRNDANYWWDTMASVHDVTAMTWERFREIFETKYFTAATRKEKKNEFINLKQGSMSVDEYIRKFEELSRYAPQLVGSDTLKVGQFLEGLKPEIYRDVTMDGMVGVTRAARALDVEQNVLRMRFEIEMQR